VVIPSCATTGDLPNIISSAIWDARTDEISCSVFRSPNTRQTSATSRAKLGHDRDPADCQNLRGARLWG